MFTGVIDRWAAYRHRHTLNENVVSASHCTHLTEMTTISLSLCHVTRSVIRGNNNRRSAGLLTWRERDLWPIWAGCDRDPRPCPSGGQWPGVPHGCYVGIQAQWTTTDHSGRGTCTAVWQYAAHCVITGWAVAQTCCISQCAKYRKSGIFGYPWEQIPWTDRHETWGA